MGDTITLTDLEYAPLATATWTQMVLVGILTINGSQTEQISFLGTYSQDGFALAQDITGVGGTDVM